MQRCIELALLGAGSVSPNPMVGSVIVHNGEIIGEGYHMKYGEAHAEVNAINDVFERNLNAIEVLKKSTIYVTLEPCAHFGKTPPCSDLIIKHKIPTVVIGCRDPFDQVNGKGIDKLKTAGIHIIEGILTEDCLALNKRFFTQVQKQRPYIILKWAQTADSYFAPTDGTKRWITSETSKTLVHKWRSEEDAILVGRNTALIDNPKLNVRQWQGKNPIRIVIDRNLELPHTLHLFDQSQKTIIFNAHKTDVIENITYLELEDFDNLLPQLIAYQLYLLDVQSIIIEGGAKTLELFIKANLWDEARVFSGPDRWESGIAAPVISGQLLTEQSVGPDLLRTYKNPHL
ncbi:MAG: riboflavin biosynthesis protein RibD [Daejeonella sp.]|nr:riboflavin biosynthesis protein RibD [Daejeonella sp.]